jgi:hypothetical protein
MLNQLIDARREQCNLHFGRPGIAGVNMVGTYDCLLLILIERHAVLLIYCPQMSQLGSILNTISLQQVRDYIMEEDGMQNGCRLLDRALAGFDIRGAIACQSRMQPVRRLGFLLVRRARWC